MGLLRSLDRASRAYCSASASSRFLFRLPTKKIAAAMIRVMTPVQKSSDCLSQ